MKTIFPIIRAFIFLVLASFSSTALSITINAQSDTLRSLDGAWGRECDEGEVEALEFIGDIFKAYVIEYASMSCTGDGTIIPEVEGSITINLVDDVDILGWVGEDNNDPPECLSGPGCTLQSNPDVTPLVAEFQDPESPAGSPPVIELLFFFMDDTILDLSGGACIYNEPGPDSSTEYQPYLVNDEPFCKIDSPGDIPPIPVPAAFWLFGTALIGFVGFSRRRKIG